MAFIARGLEKGWLRPAIGQRFSLDEASTAHEDIMGSSGAKGKIVIVISE